MRRKNPRRGYAMLLVFLFLVLFLLFLGLAYTRLSSALRIETARAQQAQRDQGPIPAVGLGLALLETGLPPSDPYVCAVTITGAGGPTSYTVTFQSEGVNDWSVTAAPTAPNSNPQPMPSTFGN
jgi:hypothetical protein